MSSEAVELPWVALTIAAGLALPSTFWLVGLLRWASRRTSRSVGSCQTSQAAVVVVGRNEETGIASCLKSVLSNPRDVVAKLLFVDDGSDDDTLEIATRICHEDPRLEVHLQRVLAPGFESPKKQALAFAFSKVTQEAVAVTDADCVVPPEWIKSMMKGQHSAAGAVLGASWPVEDRGLRAHSYRWERLTANVAMASSCGWGSPASACGHNILYRTAALREAEAPVHRSLPSGDDDLTVQAIWRRGWTVEFCDDPRSVVREAGARGSRLAQASRHQSVAHLYPIRWRVMYAWTALSGLAAYPLLLWWILSDIATVLALSLILKASLDFLCGLVLAGRLKLNISVGEIILGTLFLPAWVIWRILALAVSRKFIWKDREYANSLTGSPGSTVS